MTGLSWFRRLGPCRVETRTLGEWQVLEVRGNFSAGDPERHFLQTIDSLLSAGARRVIVDLSGSRLADESVASAASEAYHRARAAG
ncbi:MAG TPA: hypothetical protein VFT43_12405, partial [Candidatus Polarisedimenticolia bacterium]|nr:hypothetical protein [Candidatus Polarisedimenticolia bacterium]